MHRPRISTNLAISADGKITSVRRTPSGWTSAEDHQRLLDLRASADAILVGRGTLASDRMTMTVPGQIKQPLRCVVSRSAQLDLSLPIFSTPGGQIHWLATDEESNHVENSMKGGVIVHHRSLERFLGCLANEYHIKRIHCEGGGQLIRSLAELNWIDEYHLTIAGHTLFGGFQAATATGIPGDFLKNSLQFEISEFLPNPVNGECFLTYQKVAKS